MKYYKYIRILLIAIPILILSVLIYKDFNPRGELTVDYNFCAEDPIISRFSPNGRVLEIQKNRGECTQEMVIDPVYFDVRLPQRFDRAQLALWYKKASTTPLIIGPAIDIDTWQWQLKELIEIDTKPVQYGYADYNIKNTKLNHNRLRFLISSPELDANGESIVFKKIQIKFTKESLNRVNWKQRLKDWLKAFNFYRTIKQSNN